MGNGLLQSGAALGAVITPLIVMWLYAWTGDWRPAFLAVGAVGVTWVFLWLPSVRRADLALPGHASGPSLVRIVAWLVLLLLLDLAVHVPEVRGYWPMLRDAVASAPWLPLAVKALVTVLGIAGVFLWLRWATRDDTALPRRDFFRRFWVLVVLVSTINITWHYFRAWLPLFLQSQHGYEPAETNLFIAAYYVATDVGTLSAGFATLYLARRGLPVHHSRVVVFLACALLTTLSLVVAALPTGPLLLGVLLVIGFGALGLFPNYYSFSQEITVRHQGKVTGSLGCINWLVMALLHEAAGDSIKRTGNYAEGLAVAGVAPLVGLAALLLFWGKTPHKETEAPPQGPLPQAPPREVDERIQGPVDRIKSLERQGSE
jgi:hypothetical protein